MILSKNDSPALFPASFTRVKSSSFDILSLFNILFLQAVRCAELRGTLLLKYSLDSCIVRGVRIPRSAV